MWVQSMDVASPSRDRPGGDVVVAGNRPEAQLLAITCGATLLVTTNGTTPADEVLALARERGTAIIRSPLDTYVTARMITLAAPCHGLMEPGPADGQRRRPGGGHLGRRSRTSTTAPQWRSTPAGVRSGS